MFCLRIACLRFNVPRKRATHERWMHSESDLALAGCEYGFGLFKYSMNVATDMHYLGTI
jgi:hypothetical protein